jgi:drug/metabolite transporter (DMT)-like permease
VARLLSTTEAEHRGAFSLLDWTAFVGVGVIWGSSFLLTAVGLESLEPGFVTWFRIAAGAAVLWLVPDARGRLDRSDRVRIVAVSFLWVAIPLTLFPLAQRSVSSAVAGMLNGGVPLVTAAIASVMLRRPPGRAQAVGLALGFAGVVMIALPAAGEGSSQAVGVVMIVAAVVCYGLAINVVAPLQRRYGSARVMARMIGLGAVWTAPFGAIGLVGSSFAWRPVLAIAVLGAIGTGLAFVLMSGARGTRRRDASVVRHLPDPGRGVGAGRDDPRRPRVRDRGERCGVRDRRGDPRLAPGPWGAGRRGGLTAPGSRRLA